MKIKKLKTQLPFGEFCKKYIKDQKIISVEDFSIDLQDLAASFIKYYSLATPLTIQQLKDKFTSPTLTISPNQLGGKLRGINMTNQQGITTIYYSETEAPAAQVYTTLHECFELMDSSFCKTLGTTDQDPEIERHADKFAAHVQAPTELIHSSFHEHGLNLVKIRKKFECSYLTALIQLRVVLSSNHQKKPIPILGVIYEKRVWDLKPGQKKQKLDYGGLVNGFDSLRINYKDKKKNTKNMYIKVGRKKSDLHSVIMKKKPLYLKKTTLVFADTEIPVSLLIQIVKYPENKLSKVIALMAPIHHNVFEKVSSSNNN